MIRVSLTPASLFRYFDFVMVAFVVVLLLSNGIGAEWAFPEFRSTT